VVVFGDSLMMRMITIAWQGNGVSIPVKFCYEIVIYIVKV
jgi:hypothetical protein